MMKKLSLICMFCCYMAVFMLAIPAQASIISLGPGQSIQKAIDDASARRHN